MDYTISVPEEWVPLSSQLIEELQQKNTPDLRTYIIGYSASDSNAISFPYFTANYNEIPGSENALFKDAIQIQSDILKKNEHDGEFVVDSILYNFYTIQPFNSITLYRGYSVGGKGILYLTYYSDGANPEKDKLQFTNILNSVEHRVKFQNRNIYYEKAAEYKQQSGEHATRAIIACGVLIAVILLRRLMKSKA
ncbi:MAG: hypothetical protein ACK40G_05340 [Cytophagaceae bacterium]